MSRFIEEISTAKNIRKRARNAFEMSGSVAGILASYQHAGDFGVGGSTDPTRFVARQQ
jgi:hypothetical protein